MQLYTTLQDDGVVGGLTAFFLPQATTHDGTFPPPLGAVYQYQHGHLRYNIPTRDFSTGRPYD